MHKVVIDLSSARSGQDVLTAFGEALELGGPDGNRLVIAPDDGKGWGMNWDALADGLRYLGSGGIWGTSKRFDFPVRLEIRGIGRFKMENPVESALLVEILEEALGRFARSGLEFSYDIV